MLRLSRSQRGETHRDLEDGDRQTGESEQEDRWPERRAESEDVEMEAESPKHILPVDVLILPASYFSLKFGTYRFLSYGCIWI